MVKNKIIFLIFSIIISISPSFSNEVVNDYIDIATNYKNNKNYTKALEYINYALSIDPKNEDALKMKNEVLPHEASIEIPQITPVLEQDNGTKSPVIFEKKAMTNTGYNSEYYNKMGESYLLKKDYEKAINAFFKSVTINPKNYLAYNNLGTCYWKKNNLEIAEKYFQKAYSINDKYTQPLLNLSLLYKQQGKISKHYECLTKLIKMNPNNYWAYYLLGDYHTLRGEYKQSIEYNLEAIKLNPNFAPPYLSAALAYQHLEKFEISNVSLRNYLELYPHSDFAYFMLSQNYEQLAKHNQAKLAIIQAINLKNLAQYHLELAKIEFNLNEFEDAILNFELLLPEYDYAEIYNYIGLCYYMITNYDKAILNFNKAIALDNKRPIFYYNLALCQKKLNNMKEYSQSINTALQILPINYKDYVDLSYIYLNNSNTTAAIGILDTGIKNYPNIKELYLTKLNIYSSINDNLNYNRLKTEIDMRFNNYEKKKTK